MKNIIFRKVNRKKILVICCLINILFIDCTSTSAEIVKSNEQNLDREFYREVYIDKKQRFSIDIPNSWELKKMEIIHEGNKLDSLFFAGIITKYHIDSNSSLVYVYTNVPISEFVDEAFAAANQLESLINKPQRGNIIINTTDLQVDQMGIVNIGTTDLQAEYIKILRHGENDGKEIWQKVFYIPHRNKNAIVILTCSALLPENGVDLDIIFDKFVKTFNWIR